MVLQAVFITSADRICQYLFFNAPYTESQGFVFYSKVFYYTKDKDAFTPKDKIQCQRYVFVLIPEFLIFMMNDQIFKIYVLVV